MISPMFSGYRDNSVGSEVCLTTSYTALLCRFESSWGHNDGICVNGWQFSPSCSGFTGYFPVAIIYNWKGHRLSSTIELPSEKVVR